MAENQNHKGNEAERTQAFWALVIGFIGILTFFGISSYNDLKKKIGVDEESKGEIIDILPTISTIKPLLIENAVYHALNDIALTLPLKRMGIPVSSLSGLIKKEIPVDSHQTSKKEKIPTGHFSTRPELFLRAGEVYYDSLTGQLYDYSPNGRKSKVMGKLNGSHRYFYLSTSSNSSKCVEVFVEKIEVEKDTVSRAQVLNGLKWKGQAILHISAFREICLSKDSASVIGLSDWADADINLYFVVEENSNKPKKPSEPPQHSLRNARNINRRSVQNNEIVHIDRFATLDFGAKFLRLEDRKGKFTKLNLSNKYPCRICKQ